MNEYEVTKGAVLKSKVDGKFYLVVSREDIDEYDWYFTVRQILSDISEKELLTCNVEELPLKYKGIKLPDHQRFCFDLIRSVFSKLEGHYYVEEGNLMKDGQVVPRWIEFSEKKKAEGEMISGEKYSDYYCKKVLGVTDASVVFLSGSDDGYTIYSFHPHVNNLYTEMEYFGLDAYGSYLYSDQKYLCVINERSHWCDERYWHCWEENPDLDDSIPDMTDIMVLDSRGEEVYSATYYYCFGKPYFSEGCFVVYQDNDDKDLYRVFSYKNGYPRLTEIRAKGRVKTFTVDPDNNAIFIHSAESLFYIPSGPEKELCLDSPSRELRKIFKQLKGYDHVYESECAGNHYALYITNGEYKKKTFRVYGKNFDSYDLF